VSNESKGTQTRNWVELPTAPTLITPSPGDPASGAGAPSYNAGGGYIFTLTASTAAVINLATLDWQGPPDPQDEQRGGYGATGTYVTIRVNGIVPVFVVGYPTLAAYTASPPTIAGTLGANPAGFSWPIFPTPATGPDPGVDSGRFLVRRNVNSFLGMISSGTPTIYIYRSGVYLQAR
jgi:hypothetical protein